MIPIQLHHIWHHCIVPQKDSAFNISNCISQNTKWAINTSFPRPGHIYISLTVDNEEYLELIFDFNFDRRQRLEYTTYTVYEFYPLA